MEKGQFRAFSEPQDKNSNTTMPFCNIHFAVKCTEESKVKMLIQDNAAMLFSLLNL